MSAKADLLIIGRGGHARSLAVAYKGSFRVWRYSADADADLEVWRDRGTPAIVGVGQDTRMRKDIWLAYLDVCMLWRFHRVEGYAHPGLVIMPGAVVHGPKSIGVNVLINCGAIVEHGAVIGDHCSISSGATICGDVTLGQGCFVGAGATILPGNKLDDWTFIPAGSLVVEPDDIRRPQRALQGDRAKKAGEGQGSRIGFAE